MPDVYTDYRTRQPLDVGGDALAPLPAATLARRRRLFRYGGLIAFVIGVGLSLIPGPKGASDTIEYRTVNGKATPFHQFFYSRHYGRPFTFGRTDYNDDGSIRRVSVHPEALLGNLGVALAFVIVAAIFIGRPRRKD